MNDSHPLSEFPSGTLVRIDELCDCPASRGRLCSMGLTPGSVVEVNGSGRGGCSLKVRGSNLVIGCRLAHAIMGTPVNGDARPTGEAATDQEVMECTDVGYGHRGRHRRRGWRLSG